MSGSSRVVLDSDDEDELDGELELSIEVEPTASDGASQASVVGDVTEASDLSHTHGLKDESLTALRDDAQDSKRAASDATDSERGRLKRPKVVLEPQARDYVDDPYDGSQAASQQQQQQQQQQPTELQLQEVYHEVIAEPSSTVMDSATPRPLFVEDVGNAAPGDQQFGHGDITFHEDEDSVTPTKNYLTPTTSTSHQTSWNHNTMRVPVVVIPGPPQGYAKDARPSNRREPSPDELSSDSLIGVPNELYRPRPSRSRSLHRDNAPTETQSHEETNVKRSRRGASAGATMQQQQESLVGMGFRASQAKLALQVTGGNLDQAVDWLCPEKPDESTNAGAENLPQEHVRAHATEGTPDTISAASQAEAEPEPEPEPSTKKRKAAAKKKTPAKKKQRKKTVAEDAEMFQGQTTVDEPMDVSIKQEVTHAVADEQPEDELAETAPTRENREDEHSQAKGSMPSKPAKKGRGRPKKAPAPIENPVERNEEVLETKERDEATAEAIVPEPIAEADVAMHTTEAGHKESKVLVEKDTNGSNTKCNMAEMDDEAKSETPATLTKKILGEENLVRVTPPLKLKNGPVHRVGLSRRRPIQSLLRIIKR